MYKIFVFFTVLSVLGGCSYRHAQLTSGQSYIANYQADVAAIKTHNSKKKTGSKVILNQKIREAASIEPILNFPARIGLVKFENGQLIDIPETEAEDWKAFSNRRKQLGEFVNVNVLGTAAIPKSAGWRNYSRNDHTIEEIRIAAARQHLDAVLIYEINGFSRKNNTVLAVADLTIVGGAILPTRSITAESNARALLVDVRNGYPYGAASASSDIKKSSTSWGSTEREVVLKETAMSQGYEKLLPKMEEMFEDLLVQKKNTSKTRS